MMFELGRLDPKALADHFQTLVEAQVGGASMKVELHKFEQTNPGYSKNRLFISFHITEDTLRGVDMDEVFGNAAASPRKDAV